MKTLSKLIITLALFFSVAQIARAEGDAYLLNVELTTVVGTAKNDFQTGNMIQVVSIVADDPKEYDLTGSNPSSRLFPGKGTLNFESPAFARTWPGIINNDINSTLQINGTGQFTDFLNVVSFSSTRDGVNYQHNAIVAFSNTIKNFREGKEGNYKFYASIKNGDVYEYLVAGNIRSMTVCDSLCRSKPMFGVPDSTVLNFYNRDKIDAQRIRPRNPRNEE